MREPPENAALSMNRGTCFFAGPTGDVLMMYYLHDLYYQLLNYANRLTPQQWVMVLTVTLVLGMLCLRGYGSRSNY
jgi:hypothetical protein